MMNIHVFSCMLLIQYAFAPRDGAREYDKDDHVMIAKEGC